ncbi:MAG: tetratricopeptide repeat protein [Myxococcales bacterium]|jgi:tetratricopeptide (TPR) repeat protein|nr:tetratricopeptide repeat protein [Myxococcales bacterium]MBL0194843.1 tetratricopeptide repeat protein [Myxococcales bacterium]HQY63693.1 tetratricopeptide repeat protein [Polyangiaceae bacterium]
MSTGRVKQLITLGREHYAKQEFELAEGQLREALAEGDRYADVHDMLGVICHARGNFVAAEHHFERALELNPAYTEAALNLAVTYNDRGKYDMAREVYAKIKVAPGVDIEPFARGKIANMHAEVGEAYADAGMLREAVREYETATKLCPGFADLHVRLAVLHRELGDHQGARLAYESAISAREGYVPARIGLGITLLSLGDTDGAAAQWQRALELEPESAQAKLYLRMLERTRTAPPPPPCPSPA